jgi:hypothetical protein
MDVGWKRTSDDEKVDLREQQIDAENTHYMNVEIIDEADPDTHGLTVGDILAFVVLDGVEKPDERSEINENACWDKNVSFTGIIYKCAQGRSYTGTNVTRNDNIKVKRRIVGCTDGIEPQ